LSVVICLFHVSLYLVVVITSALRRREIPLALKAEFSNSVFSWWRWRSNDFAISFCVAVVGAVVTAMVAGAMIAAYHRSAVIIVVSLNYAIRDILP
jgi:hypothetical protein